LKTGTIDGQGQSLADVEVGQALRGDAARSCSLPPVDVLQLAILVKTWNALTGPDKAEVKKPRPGQGSHTMKTVCARKRS